MQLQQSDWESWQASPTAQHLLHQEEAILDEMLPTLFGYHLLQVGDTFSDHAFASSAIKHHIAMSLFPQTGHGLCADAHRLPFASESLDLICLPHVLEFSDSPHQVLREVDRCLIPEGHVILFGFNPWSMWQLYRLFMRWRCPVPWQGHYFGKRRIKDWLTLLGFELLQSQCFMFHPPINSRPLHKKMTALEQWGRRVVPGMGAAYVILARKRTETLTPIRPHLSPPRMIGVGLGKT